MTDNDTLKTIIDKKFDNYYSSREEARNFSIPGELTVTITLAEYRDLLKKVAISDCEQTKINNKYWDMKQKNEELQNEISQLRAKISNLVIPNDDAKEE